jgi:hypothetical protein
MTLFQRLTRPFLRQNPPQNPGIVPPPSGQPLAPPRPKSITELEREMQAQVQVQQIKTYPHQQAPAGRRVFNKLVWVAILVGVPIAMLWVINLPYAPIRRPIARTAPILLLPSYISIDNNYREAIALVEQSKQLINYPTSAADLDLGEQKVAQAQERLDAIPIDLFDTFPEYRYWWYDWRFSSGHFTAARGEVAQLKAKVFQEKNAQTALFDATQALNTAKQQYQQSTTSVDKQAAIAAWQAAIDQLEQIPGLTLAGKTAQQKLVADKRDFQTIVGLAAGNQRTITLIDAAKRFSWEAAKAGQNPPHTVKEWIEIEKLWQQAIDRLELIPQQDLAGYAEAQKLLARYTTNLGEIEVRRQAEEDAVSTVQEAKMQIQRLLATADAHESTARTASQIQGIIDQLERVQPGTKAYLEAQQLLLSANNKLNQLQP